MIKPTIHTIKNLGRRITGYRARLLGIEAISNTKEGAAAAVVENLQSAVSRLAFGTFIGRYQGETFVISPTTQGYSTWISLFERTDYNTVSAGTFVDQVRGALGHIAHQHFLPIRGLDHGEELIAALPQNIPAFDRAQRERLAEELRSYFRWQTRYFQARQLGHDDQTARNWAGELLRVLPESPLLPSIDVIREAVAS